MSHPFPSVLGIDHVHVYVANREAAVAWYARTLGFTIMNELSHWAADGGPLTIADTARHVHLALFERPMQPHRSTVALGTTAVGLLAWQQQLTRELPKPPSVEDHGQSVSLYFSDPDGNPYEVTTYEAAEARALLQLT